MENYREEPTETSHFLYCEEIFVPPSLPNILKQYSKAAIRTQPRDLLLWTSAYFRALVNGEIPPTKDRLECSSKIAPSSGLTPGLLKVLEKQFKMRRHVSVSEIKLKWTSLCLPPAEVDCILAAAKVDPSGLIEWSTFLGLAARTMCQNLTQAMELICNVVTEEPDGCTPSIAYLTFTGIYERLAVIEEIPPNQIKQVLNYLRSRGDLISGLVGPPDFDSLSNCPPLQ